MKNLLSRVILGLGVACLVAGVMLFTGVISRGVVYSGKIIFNTDGEYARFKTAIASEDVSYHNEGISVLSSTPPIVVQFEVRLDSDDYVFPYGERRNNLEDTGVLAVGGAALVIFSSFLLREES